MTANDMIEKLPQTERDLVVAGLQALFRERVSAWNSASNVAFLRKTMVPERELFGLDEVFEMLRRFGGIPSSF